MFRQFISSICIISLMASVITPGVFAQSLPAVSPLSVSIPAVFSVQSAVLKGLKVYPERPLDLSLVIDSGDAGSDVLRAESQKLTDYFMVALTIPAEDLWVNLSPDEPDRLASETLSRTRMGEELLKQDLELKKVTSDYLNFNNEAGRKVWDAVYQSVYEASGSMESASDIIGRIWIVPEEAVVYESGDLAFVAESRLKVLSERTYQASRSESVVVSPEDSAQKIFEDAILPKISEEVNHGEDFAELRRIFHALILANWYKQKFRDFSFHRDFVDRRMVPAGDGGRRNLEAVFDDYKKNYSSGEKVLGDVYDPDHQAVVVRQTVTGGITAVKGGWMRVVPGRRPDAAMLGRFPHKIDLKLAPVQQDDAMMAENEKSVHDYFNHFWERFSELTAAAERNFLNPFDVDIKDDYSKRMYYFYNMIQECAQKIEVSAPYGIYEWDMLRRRFIGNLGNDKLKDLKIVFFDSVMRKALLDEFYAVDYKFNYSRRNINLANVMERVRLNGQTVEHLLQSVLNRFLPWKLGNDAEDFRLEADYVREYLKENNFPMNAGVSVEFLKPIFYQKKTAFMLFVFKNGKKREAFLAAFQSKDSGVYLDAVISGPAVRDILFSFRRSNFMVDVSHLEDLSVYLKSTFRDVAFGEIYYALGIFGLTKSYYLTSLRHHLQKGAKINFASNGVNNIVFNISSFPFVLKAIKAHPSDPKEFIMNQYRSIHESERSGRVLDTMVFRNISLPINAFSRKALQVIMSQLDPASYKMDNQRIIFQRVYFQPKLVTADKYLKKDLPSKKKEEIYLKVGWTIRALRDMGFIPLTVTLDKFGITPYGEVVYLNNTQLRPLKERVVYDVTLIKKQLDIPEEFREVFDAVHERIFDYDFWHQERMGQEFEVLSYAPIYRIRWKKLEQTVRREWGAYVGRINSQGGGGHALGDIQVRYVSLEGLNFLRIESQKPVARVLVVEPIAPNLIAELHYHFQDVHFDILLSDSEVLEQEDGEKFASGIRNRLVELVRNHSYDYVIGYVNEDFNADFFKFGRLKALLLLSTGLHNIDLIAAAAYATLVVNAPGATTVAVTEHTIGLMWDGLFAPFVDENSPKPRRSLGDWQPQAKEESRLKAQVIWYALLKKTLELERMFEFASSGRYLRTGVGTRATVYHEQLGRNLKAGINHTIGIVGLDETGLSLIEAAMAFEITRVFVDQEEYDNLSEDVRQRLALLSQAIAGVSGQEGCTIIPVRDVSQLKLSYMIINRPDDRMFSMDESRIIRTSQLSVSEDFFGQMESFGDLTLGIQGFGRIGQALLQRTLPFYKNTIIFQRDFQRTSYQQLLSSFVSLGEFWYPDVNILYSMDKEKFFRESNLILPLAPSNDETDRWVDGESLEWLGKDTRAPFVRVLVSVVKNRVDERDLREFLANHPEAQARLDVLENEEEGNPYAFFLDLSGQPLENVRFTGHTAAAVLAIRHEKIQQVLRNLRLLLKSQRPESAVNAEYLAEPERKSNRSHIPVRETLVRLPAYKLFRELSRDPLLKKIFKMSSGEFDRMKTIRTRSMTTIRQFNKYFSDRNMPLGRGAFRLGFALHDTGKAIGRHNEHEMNSVKILEYLRHKYHELLISDKDYTLFRALILGSSLGSYFRGRSTLEQTVAKVRYWANEAGLSLEMFLEIMTIYYQSDVSSYTRDVVKKETPLDYLFEFDANRIAWDGELGIMKFSPDVREKYMLLKRAIDSAMMAKQYGGIDLGAGYVQNQGDIKPQGAGKMFIPVIYSISPIKDASIFN